MPEDLGFLTMHSQASAVRPLLGLTVLVVEDSRYASEAVRLLCLRSGARIRRADSLLSAHRHLRVYRPSVVIVDLGLPDGSGVDLIAELAVQDEQGRPVILATSGADGEEHVERALAAGANDFLPKPLESVAAFQQAIIQQLPGEMRPMGPRLMDDETIDPDRLALNEDLSHLDELLKGGPETLGYVAPFLQGLARLAGDDALRSVSEQLVSAWKSQSGRKIAIEEARDVIGSHLKVSALV